MPTSNFLIALNFKVKELMNQMSMKKKVDRNGR